MKKVGLTGGISSGKSTSVKILLENGFKVIDSDKIVKDILKYDTEVFNYIKDNFGDKFLNEGNIRNKEFGEYIFTYDDERKKYEDFIMPKIFRKIDEEFNFYEKNGERVCILDAPLLIEKNLHLGMDYVVLIWINKDEQLRRLLNRDNLTKESALKRINSQIDLDMKKQFANFIIDNSKDKVYLSKQIEALITFLNTL